MQMENDKKLNQFQRNLNNLKLLGFSLPKKCEKAINVVSCHYYFPRCDSTSDSYKAQTLCKETCQYFINTCSPQLKILNVLSLGNLINITNCTNFSWRNAGESPECFYFKESDDESDALKLQIKRHDNECLNKTGRSYQGNISFTSSGILCQPWTSQCPHRHTMESTYPELKNASNCCRNPRDSGQRPWCFTSDKNKRWEYCDIPSCLPAHATVVETTSVQLFTKSSGAIKTMLPTKFAKRTGAGLTFTSKFTPTVNISKRCVQAVAMPSVKASCVPLQYNSYCSNKGIQLDQFVFVKSDIQKENDKKLNLFQSNLDKFRLLGFSFSEKCEKAINIVYCHHFYPRCDSTGDSYKAQRLCKETCQYFTYSCNQELALLNSFPAGSSSNEIIKCTHFLSRDPGQSPECYYFDERDNENGQLNVHIARHEKGCLHENGRGYQGNKSVTSSGIICQSWAAQCPHRHTMVSTYPELKNASNCCRNPSGSGQRPWCFTSDKNKRWEYCNIPSCSIAVTPEKTSMVPTKITNKPISYQQTELPTIPTSNVNKNMCSPAIPLPTIKPPCTRLDVRFGAYCVKHGVNLESYVFKNFEDQQTASSGFNDTLLLLEKFKPIYNAFNNSKNCIHAALIAFCHYGFPACDRTGSTIQERKPCKASCDYVMKTCMNVVKVIEQFKHENFDCSTFPIREAGSSPECWYYDGQLNETHSSNDYTNDCLYLDGRGYEGNISYTASGIQCQSWTAQCPHRHTMVSTYPKLKNASNYCRNPGGSGKRPWCFTSDKNKRWEYCHIESDCLPVNGGYGNWTLSKKCNSTCGQGIDVWRRYCNTPAPRYGGKNCSLLGSAVEIRNCSNLPPCPRNGNYGKWTQNTTCNVSCGDGFEMWTRKCDSPSPAYGGYNCSKLGEGEKWKSCQKAPCENPPKEINDSKIAISAGVGPVVLVILVIFVVLGYKRMKRRYEPYATLRFDRLISMKPREKSEDSAKLDVASVPPHSYANLDEVGEPIPGACRGIILDQQPYINTTSLNRPYYAKLQIFTSITLDWLRNAWGQVDEMGKHVYDTLRRGMELLLPYDKLEKSKDGSQRNRSGAIDENGCAEYDRFDRRPTVLMPKDSNES